jgi:hypothetical protein
MLPFVRYKARARETIKVSIAKNSAKGGNAHFVEFANCVQCNALLSSINTVLFKRKETQFLRKKGRRGDVSTMLVLLRIVDALAEYIQARRQDARRNSRNDRKKG